MRGARHTQGVREGYRACLDRDLRIWYDPYVLSLGLILEVRAKVKLVEARFEILKIEGDVPLCTGGLPANV